MIRVIIIEDNAEKLRRVVDLLEKVCSLEVDQISCASNVRDGRSFLEANQYDLLLLDLVLPVNEGLEPSKEAGIKFLDEIYYNPNINIPVHIIGLTQFDSVFKDYENDFEDKVWSLINFNISDTDWEDKLKSKVFYLQSFKKSYSDFIKSESTFDIAIITALNKEVEQLKRLIPCESMEDGDGYLTLYKSTLSTYDNNIKKILICSINNMGMHATAAVSSKIIARYSPKYIFMTGICGGVQDAGVKLGDLIIATQLWDYESGKITEDDNGNLNFNPDMKCLNSDHGIISKLNDFSSDEKNIINLFSEFSGIKPNNLPNVIFGSVGSGPYVLKSKKYLKKLTESDRKLCAIDMEGYGLYLAGEYFPHTIPVFVKCVSDLGDMNKDDNFQKYASYLSSNFVLKFIFKYL